MIRQRSGHAVGRPAISVNNLLNRTLESMLNLAISYFALNRFAEA